MDDKALLKELRVGWEYAYLHDDWVTTLEEALDGVDAVQAHWRPPSGAMGIFDIVMHLTVWNEDIVIRIQTGQKSHPKEGAWPPRPSSPNKGEWLRWRKRLWESCSKVDRLLHSTTMDQINASPYGLGDLLCRLTHMGYHIGQITKLREWYESSR